MSMCLCLCDDMLLHVVVDNIKPLLAAPSTDLCMYIHTYVCIYLSLLAPLGDFEFSVGLHVPDSPGLPYPQSGVRVRV